MFLWSIVVQTGWPVQTGFTRVLSAAEGGMMNGCRVLAWGKGQKASILSLQGLSRRPGLLIIFMQLSGKAPSGPDWIVRHHA